MSNELLQKVIATTNAGTDKPTLLSPEQSNKFLDYIWDGTVLGKTARTVRMKSDTVEIDKMYVGQRIARLATEAVDDGVNAGATFTKISLVTKKIRLDWELSHEALEDNIEGADLEDHVARLMATQLGNDLEDLAINGDTTSSDPLIKSFDGWRKLALAGGHVVDAGGAPLTLAVFKAAYKAMPRKYKNRRQQLRFYSGSNSIQDYLFSLTNITNTPEEIAAGVIRGTGNAVLGGDAGFVSGYALGIPVIEVPYFLEDADGDYSGATGDHGAVELTFPQNRLWGIKRDVTVYSEYKPKKDTIEYTVFTRVGVQIEDLDCYVVVKNVKVAA